MSVETGREEVPTSQEPIESRVDVSRVWEQSESLLFKEMLWNKKMIVDKTIQFLLQKNVKWFEKLSPSQKESVTNAMLVPLIKVFTEKWWEETYSILTKVIDSIDKTAEEEVENLQNILNSLDLWTKGLIENNYNNLSKLLEYIEANKDSLGEKADMILNNPEMLSKIIETWKYEENWFEIDLNSPEWVKFSIDSWKFPGAAVFEEWLWELIRTKWDNLSALNTKDIAQKLFESGLDIESLTKIPIIWDFLKFIFGLILWTEWMEVLNTLSLEKRYKPSIENFIKYTSWAENLPFKKDKFDEVWEDKKNIISFLKMVESKENLSNWEESIISSNDFWTKVLSKEDTDPKSVELIDIIRREVQKINPNQKDMTQSDFLKALSLINVVLPKAETKPEWESKAEWATTTWWEKADTTTQWEWSPDWATEGTETKEKKVYTLEQLNEIEKLPAKIIIAGKELVLNIDEKAEKIILWDREFKVISKTLFSDNFESVKFEKWEFIVYDKEILVRKWEEVKQNSRNLNAKEVLNAINTDWKYRSGLFSWIRIEEIIKS